MDLNRLIKKVQAGMIALESMEATVYNKDSYSLGSFIRVLRKLTALRTKMEDTPYLSLFRTLEDNVAILGYIEEHGCHNTGEQGLEDLANFIETIESDSDSDSDPGATCMDELYEEAEMILNAQGTKDEDEFSTHNIVQVIEEYFLKDCCALYGYGACEIQEAIAVYGQAVKLREELGL